MTHRRHACEVGTTVNGRRGSRSNVLAASPYKPSVANSLSLQPLCTEMSYKITSADTDHATLGVTHDGETICKVCFLLCFGVFPIFCFFSNVFVFLQGDFFSPRVFLFSFRVFLFSLSTFVFSPAFHLQFYFLQFFFFSSGFSFSSGFCQVVCFTNVSSVFQWILLFCVFKYFHLFSSVFQCFPNGFIFPCFPMSFQCFSVVCLWPLGWGAQIFPESRATY